MSTATWLIVSSIALGLTGSSQVQAGNGARVPPPPPPKVRQIDGNLSSLNLRQKTLTIKVEQDSTSQLLVVRLTEQTEIRVNRKAGSAPDLLAGMTISAQIRGSTAIQIDAHDAVAMK